MHFLMDTWHGTLMPVKTAEPAGCAHTSFVERFKSDEFTAFGPWCRQSKKRSLLVPAHEFHQVIGDCFLCIVRKSSIYCVNLAPVVLCCVLKLL